MENMRWIGKNSNFEAFIFSFHLEGTPASLILLDKVLKYKHQTATEFIKLFESESNIIQWLVHSPT